MYTSHKSKFSHKKRLKSQTFHETTSKLRNEVSILSLRGCKKIQIEVHRAAGVYEYENTLKAVRKAVEMEMEKIEIDVWLLKDQQVAVLHGENDGYITTIDNTKDLIENFGYSELKSKVCLPNGDYIPTLNELLELCKGKLDVNIELKGENLDLLSKVFEIVEKTKMFDSICISSFYHPFYEKFLELKKSFKIKGNICFGFLLWQENDSRQFFDNIPKRFFENKNSINLELTLLMKFKWIREKVKEMKLKGILLGVYYPFAIKETYQNAKFISELGIDFAICNDPMIIKKFNSYFN